MDAQIQHAQKVVSLFESYLKVLGDMSLKTSEYQAQELIAAERERILDLPAARTAVSNLLASTASPVPTRAVVRAAPEIPADAEVKEWQLYRPQNEAANITMGLDLGLEMIAFSPDMRVSKSSSYYSSGRSESGDTWHIPRVRITARNANLPPDCRLVIDYYSRSLTETERYREKTDTIALPLLEKGMSFSATGQGVNVYRSYSQSFALRSSTESIAGKRFHGVVITIVGGDGTVLMRRFSPQNLVRETSSAEENGGSSHESP
jgi:hypothetical protein